MVFFFFVFVVFGAPRTVWVGDLAFGPVFQTFFQKLLQGFRGSGRALPRPMGGSKKKNPQIGIVWYHIVHYNIVEYVMDPLILDSNTPMVKNMDVYGGSSFWIRPGVWVDCKP